MGNNLSKALVSDHQSNPQGREQAIEKLYKLNLKKRWSVLSKVQPFYIATEDGLYELTTLGAIVWTCPLEGVKSVLFSVNGETRLRLLQHQDKHKWTPLHLASRYSTADCVKAILDSVNEEDRVTLLRMQEKDGWSPLHLASRYNTTDCVKAILESVEKKAVLLKIQNICQLTALHLASRYNTADCVKAILDSVSAEERVTLLVLGDKYQWTPLCHAVCSKTADCVQVILDTLSLEDKSVLLKTVLPKIQSKHQLTSLDLDSYVKVMLASVNAGERAAVLGIQDKHNFWTTLHHASRYNTAGYVKAILDSVSVDERIALLKVQDHLQWNPLHMASRYNTADCVNVLLESVDKETLYNDILVMKTADGSTALMLAVLNEDHSETLGILLSHIQLDSHRQQANGNC